MLRVRKGYEDLARYVAARLSLADEAVRLLIHYDEPLALDTIAQESGVAADAMADALASDFRLGRDDQHRFYLRASDELAGASNAPVLTVLHKSLFWRGLPTSAHDLAVEVSSLKEPRFSSKSIERMMRGRPLFISCGDRWLLNEWLADQARLEPGFVLVERLSANSRSKHGRKSACTVLKSVLSRVPAPVPIGLLHPLPELPLLRPRELLHAVLECDHTVFLRNGHLAMSDWLAEVRAGFCCMTTAERRDMEQALEEASERHAGDEGFSSLQSLIRREAAELALHRLRQQPDSVLALSELLQVVPDQVELLKRLGAHELSEDEATALASRMQSEIENSLLSSLRHGDVLFLSDNAVAVLAADRVQEIADCLRSPINGLTTEELCSRLWSECAIDGVDDAALAEDLAEHLADHDIEHKDGYWHASRARLKELLSKHIGDIERLVSEKPRPTYAGELLFGILPVAEDCPLAVRLVLDKVLEQVSKSASGLWWLSRGACWTAPKELATADRIHRLVDTGIQSGDHSLASGLREVLGLQLDLLFDDELSELLAAFRASMPCQAAPSPDEPALAREDEVTEVREEQHNVYEPVPPAQSRITLTEGMIERQTLRLGSGARQIIGECFGDLQGIRCLHVAVEGRYEVPCLVLKEGRELLSEELFSWLANCEADAGDLVVIHAPIPPQQVPHIALELPDAREAGTGTERGPALHLRERIADVLTEGGQAIHIDHLVVALRRRLGDRAAKASIASTLSSNYQLFAAWGRAIWGLREWADDWTDYVDPQLLAWRIDDEDLVHGVLSEAGQPMLLREIVAEIARRLVIRVQQVREITLPIREDDRLRYDDATGLVSLAVWSRGACPLLRYCARLLEQRPRMRRAISRWFASRWNLSLEHGFARYGIDI